MIRFVRPTFGLIGQVVAILLLTTTFEFGVSTLLYEQASRFAVRDDEARRLAEHLTISRRLVSEREPGERAAMAAELSTDRYALRWTGSLPAPPPIAPSLDEIEQQVLAWEPALRRSDLRLHLASPGRQARIAGGLRLDDGSWLGFRTLQPVTTLDLATERILLALIPAAALLILGGLAVQHALEPLRRLIAAADRVGSGAQEHVPEAGPSDIVRVITAFNRMQDRIHRLIGDRTQALAAVGHDIRTPLARLRLRADAVQDADVRTAIRGDVGEMEAMIASLLAYLGGEQEPEPRTVTDVAVLCATVVDEVADRGHAATYHGPDHLEERLRPLTLKRALVNLVENAIRHGDTIDVRLEQRAGMLTITVEDDGPGIAEHQLASVVEPFVRLDEARGRDASGLGLGLAIVQRSITLEGGTLHLSNRARGGLRARLQIPTEGDR